MQAHGAKPVGSGGCQVSALTQSNACRREAYREFYTGKYWIKLCRKHAQSMGDVLGMNRQIEAK